MKKEFIFDTRSPITMMPPDERILESTGIQKIAIRYQDNSETEEFWVKIPVNLCTKTINKKRKTNHERTDITLSLVMDWMKASKLTIGRIQSAEKNQSEKERIIN